MNTPYDLYMDFIKEARAPYMVSPQERTGPVRPATAQEATDAAKRIKQFHQSQQINKTMGSVKDTVNQVGEKTVGAIRNAKGYVNAGAGVAGSVMKNVNNVANEFGGIDNIVNTGRKFVNKLHPPAPPTMMDHAAKLFKKPGVGLAAAGVGGLAAGLGGAALMRSMSQPSQPQY